VETRKIIAEKQISSTTVEKDSDYGPTRAYFTEMGIDTAKIMPLVLGTLHRDVYRMTPQERLATRLVTRVTTGHTLLPAAPAADTASAAPEAAAPAAPAIPAAPQTAEGPQAAPSATATPPLPVAVQQATDVRHIAAMADLSASLAVLRPPPEDVIELFIRLKSASGARVRPAQYKADIQFSNGKRLTAGATGEDMIDPLYATLAREDYCALRRAGNLLLKVTLTRTDLTGWPRWLQFDLARISGDAEFAAKHCK
jgi:hypothetical protein